MTATEQAKARRAFWRKKRLLFNGALLAACGAAGVLMAVLEGAWRLFPPERSPVAPKGPPGWFSPILVLPFLFAFMVVVANVLYLLAPLSEAVVRPREPEVFRTSAFRLAFNFSIALPLMVASMYWAFFFKIQLFGP